MGHTTPGRWLALRVVITPWCTKKRVKRMPTSGNSKCPKSKEYFGSPSNYSSPAKTFEQGSINTLAFRFETKSTPTISSLLILISVSARSADGYIGPTLGRKKDFF